MQKVQAQNWFARHQKKTRQTQNIFFHSKPHDAAAASITNNILTNNYIIHYNYNNNGY